MGLPMLPVAHNAGWLWPKGMLNKHPGTITLVIGAPIDPAGTDVPQLTARVESWIENEVARLGPP
jgi:1-acyl-sn-glycerol-3-phosphate acyltransferase